MLYEFGELSKTLPKRRKYLHYYIVGFVDAEGCFSVSIKRQKDTRFGYVVDPVFHVVQSEEGKIILEVMKEILSCGRIERKHGQDEWQFIVDNRRQLQEKVIPFFKKNKLIVKAKQFESFADIVQRLERREHWKKEGFINLLKKAYAMSRQARKRTLDEILSEI